MSRNLLSSSCCGNTVRLADLRGQPIEFRRYGIEPVAIGTKWVCPSCRTAYFAIWQGGYDEQPKFAIDLSYYDSFNDEPAVEPVDEALHLCLNNADDNQNVLGP